MLATGVRFVLAAVLLAAAGLKLAAPRRTQTALTTFGLVNDGLRWLSWTAAVALELALAGTVAAGFAAAAYAAAAWMLIGAAAIAAAIASGRGGAPCGCFGTRSRIGRAGIVRNIVLAAALAALPSLPDAEPSVEAWLATGVAVTALAVVGLTIALLALAREVAELRLRVGPQAALEIPHEGPEIGSRTSLVTVFGRAARTRFALAVFTSEGCAVCRSLEPALALVRSDPLVALRVFDEHRDDDAWRALDVPGAPYAVALSLDGAVLAKGTFNTAAQLESVLAAAERREREALHA